MRGLLVSRIFGAGPCALSHSAGDGEEIAVAVACDDIGKDDRRAGQPGLCRLLRRRSIAPSASSSFSRRLRAILSAPLMSKARAISRLPILPRALPPNASRSRAMKARMSSRDGSGRDFGAFHGFGDVRSPCSPCRGRLFSRLAGLFRFWRRRLSRRVCGAGFAAAGCASRCRSLGRRLFRARLLWRGLLFVPRPRPGLVLDQADRLFKRDRLGETCLFKVALILPWLT